MPRATTAAWLVMPPRVVRMPRAACMPWMSSGLVSIRTRITASPRLAQLSASSAENTTLPEAAPGEAGRPRASTVILAAGSSIGCSSWSSEFGLDAADRLVAVDDALPRPATPRSSAPPAAVRLPVRVCSIHSLPALDGELDVLHVAVVVFERAAARSSSSANTSGITSSIAGRVELVSLACRRPSGAAACGCRRRHPRPAR